MTYICANDHLAQTDAKTIQSAIRAAKESGVDRVCIPHYNKRTDSELWIIDEAIVLPSDIEILIDDAHLMLADGTYTNMFTAGSPNKNTAKDTLHNIHIHGRGRAVLDGGSYNGLSERNSEKNGLPHIVKNTTLLFFNVDGLVVEDISVINQRWWGVTNIFVSNATFRNIYFKSDFSRIDENGVHHADEEPRTYEEVYVKNADGIDLRVGCHNVLIENISGFLEDDSVALTALGGFERALGYYIEGGDADIHNVTVKNITTASYCAGVRLLNENGYKLYNVTVDGVNDLRAFPAHRNNAVRIGDTLYAETDSELGDTHHITVRNVTSRSHYGVSVCKGLVDSVIENVTVLDGLAGVSTFKSNPATLQHCKIGHILPLAKDSVALNAEYITFIE